MVCGGIVRVASSILLTVEKPTAWRREWTSRGGDETLTGFGGSFGALTQGSFVPPPLLRDGAARRNPGLGDAIPSGLPGMFKVQIGARTFLSNAARI